MPKTFALALLICTTIFGEINAQEIFLNQELTLKKSSYVINETFPAVNEINHDFVLFFNEAATLYGYQYNQKKEVIGQINLDDIPKKLKVLLGYSINGQNHIYNIFSTNSNRSKFLITQIDFDSQIATSAEFSFKTDKELFLQAISHENKFYLISIEKKSSKLNIYEFGGTQEYKHVPLDLSEIDFINQNGKARTLYSLLSEYAFIADKNGFAFRGANYSDLSFIEIDNSVPNPLMDTSHKNKLYFIEDNIHLTLDENNQFTQVISINLNSLKWSFAKYDKPMQNTPENDKKTNSFIYDKYILSIACSEYGLIFNVMDLATKKVIKEHSVLKNGEITFKNVPIRQTSWFNKEFDDTNKFIKKLMMTNAAISLYPLEDSYEITFGGYKQSKHTRPIQYGGNTYSTQSIQTKGLFNTDFEHIEGGIPIEINAYDQIIDFNKSQRYGLDSETVFKYGENLIWGGYDRKTNSYILRKFTD